MAWLHHPLVGDPVYTGRLRRPAGIGPALEQALRGFQRQALHARRLGFEHPLSRKWVEGSAPRPADMSALLAALGAEGPGRFEGPEDD